MANASPNPFLEMFEDPERIRNYADGPTRFTPGFADLHKMVSILIRERAASDARVLIHGAGGGLEIESLARANPDWQFVGVDPAKPMLDQAKARLADVMHRVSLHHGFIDSAPQGPFEAATSLLTLHFLDEAERLDTLKQIVARLKPGAPFVAVHSSFPQTEPERDAWMARYEAFALASGVEPEMASMARQAVAAMPTVFEPQHDLQMMRDAGFTDVATFYTAFTWRGWVGYAP